MMKNRITKAERQQLMGLMTLAHHHSKKLDEVMEAAGHIIEEPDFWGTHMGDAFYDYKANPINEFTIDELLKKMGIEVV